MVDLCSSNETLRLRATPSTFVRLQRRRERNPDGYFPQKRPAVCWFIFRSCWATFCSTQAKMWGEGKISICPSAGPSVASSHIPHVLAAQRFNLFTTPVTTRSTCTWRIKRFRNNSDYWAIVEVIIWTNFQTTRLSRLLEYEAFYAIYNNCIKLSWISLQ